MSIVTSFVLLNPKVRSELTNLFFNRKRVVLAQMEMDFGNQKYKVIKVSGVQGLSIEIYKYTDEGSLLVDSQVLTDKKDGFYKFEDEKYNLFLKDINGDGYSEIVTPTVDKNMRGRLNVFLFDPDTEQLRKVSEH